MPTELTFATSPRFARFVKLLVREKVIELGEANRPRVIKNSVFRAIGQGLFLYYVARGLNRARRVTFVPLAGGKTAVLVEVHPGRGVFLRGPLDSSYAPMVIGDGMQPRQRVCAGRALLLANWSIYGTRSLPTGVPDCAPCGPACGVAQWMAQRLKAHPDEAPALTAGHALIVNAPGAFFEAAFTEPIEQNEEQNAEPDRVVGSKLLSMELFDAFVTLDLAAQRHADVYIPNSYLLKPVRSPYEYDAVVYERKKHDLVIVETALGTVDEPEALEEEEQGDERRAEGRVARRLKRKYVSHGGFAAYEPKRYRYVYATIRALPKDTKERDVIYMRHLLEHDRSLRLVELETLVPEITSLDNADWWKPEVLRRAFTSYITATRRAAYVRSR
jgi:hypothetical protein